LYPTFERPLRDSILNFLRLLAERGVGWPAFIFVTIADARGLFLIKNQLFEQSEHQFDQEVLELPEIEVTDGRFEDVSLKMVLDIVWNAVGVASSPSFDSDGNWRSN
jgi:hypothetical protein